MPEHFRKGAEYCVVMAFFALLAFAGAAVCFLTVRDFASARESVSWPAVEGVVLSAQANGPAELRYAYMAGGKTRESSRIRFATASFNPAPMAAKNPGQPIDVFVDPDHPDLSVIEPGGSGLVFAAVAGAAGLIVFLGLGGMIRTCMRARVDRPPNPRRLSTA